jgi:hypothetical protein
VLVDALVKVRSSFLTLDPKIISARGHCHSNTLAWYGRAV